MNFLEAVRAGGKVSTKKIGKDKYKRSCLLDGKTYQDRVRKKKTK